MESGRSRFPVYGESSDDVLGMVYVKDAYEAERTGGGGRGVLEVARPVLFVPETKRVAELLTEMQARNTHIAVAVDEYGGTAGLVTLEDLLEELVGEIHDEFDEEGLDVDEVADGIFLVNATLNVGELNERLDLSLPEGTWDSVGGLVFGTLGRVPAPGDAVDLDGCRIVVDRVDGRRVSTVRVQRVGPAGEEDRS